MHTLSITADHYPYESKRVKPRTSVKHMTEEYARIVVHVSGKRVVEKTIVIYGLSSGPVHYKITIVMQYVAAHIKKNKVSLSDSVSYEDVLNWMRTTAK